jgi:hypothetical protein
MPRLKVLSARPAPRRGGGWATSDFERYVNFPALSRLPTEGRGPIRGEVCDPRDRNEPIRATGSGDEQITAPTRVVQYEVDRDQVSVRFLDLLHAVGGPTELDRVQCDCQGFTHSLRHEVDQRLAVCAEEPTPELHFLVGLHVGSGNAQHPLRRTVGPGEFGGRNATPGGVTRRCRPGGSRPDESA